MRRWTLTLAFYPSTFCINTFSLHLLTKQTTRSSDIPLLNWLYKKSRELGRRLHSYRGEVAAYHPKFPAGSPAAVKERDTPVSTSAPDIVYSDADDEAISKYHRDTGESPLSDRYYFNLRALFHVTVVASTTWHSVSFALAQSILRAISAYYDSSEPAL